MMLADAGRAVNPGSANERPLVLNKIVSFPNGEGLRLCGGNN